MAWRPPSPPRQSDLENRCLEYPGISVGSENMMRKNWEGTNERNKGELAKWRWSHSHRSSRGRVWLLGNLVASLLWHCLTYVYPPAGLLAQLNLRWSASFGAGPPGQKSIGTQHNLLTWWGGRWPAACSGRSTIWDLSKLLINYS